MTPYRFVGDASCHLHNTNSTVYDSPTSTLGHIVVFIPQNITTGSSITESLLYISVFGGLNDTARLGYQVYSPFIVQPALLSSTPGVYQPISTSNPGNAGGIENVNPKLSCPGAYFGG